MVSRSVEVGAGSVVAGSRSVVVLGARSVVVLVVVAEGGCAGDGDGDTDRKSVV